MYVIALYSAKDLKLKPGDPAEIPSISILDGKQCNDYSNPIKLQIIDNDLSFMRKSGYILAKEINTADENSRYHAFEPNCRMFMKWSESMAD